MKRTRWWNEKVKQAIKNSKVAYLKWLQQQTPEAKERYQLAQKEAKRVVIYARNEEWAELGRSLQEDFQKIRNGSGVGSACVVEVEQMELGEYLMTVASW